ncbi:MAG TPA: DNA mismatch repair endonuclease MutL [Blastocatellia bacterium]|nr:DNA mismatch repair endonuclease MutL [Blastocatellia bacterium]
MSKIRVLPDILINKIAAGEVVERPSSVVKELLENSIDAGATRIAVTVENGGRRLMRITDDGCGMTRDDAILAFERHATSKLRSAEDLEAIATLGFRGEALPSIASVSKLTLDTKTESDLEGTRIEISGGKIFSVKDIAWPGGTEISVADLFFNLPARKKFLRAETTELYHISNLVTHYALANPGLSFVLSHNGRELINVSPVESLRDRAYQLFGNEFLSTVVELKGETPGARVSGFISKPGHARSTRESQYFFVNGRFVKDKIISRAVANAYRNVLPSGMFPSAIIFLEVPLDDVDVNAHPAKTEVRFRKANLVQDAIFEAIRAKIAEHKPVPDFPALVRQINSPVPETRTNAWSPRTFDNGGYSTASSFNKSAVAPFQPREPGEINYQQSSPAPRIPPSPSAFPNPEIYDSSPFVEQADGAPVSAEGLQALPSESCSSSSLLEFASHEASTEISAHTIRPLAQLRDSFIIATDEHGLLLIDQHVAHERVLFEQHLDRYTSKTIDVQRLLLPEAIDLTPAQAAAFGQIQSELEANGFEVMTLSGRTIALQAVPAGITMGDARALLTDLLNTVEQERAGLTIDDIRAEIAAGVACKAAIKVNMPLTMEKMTWLIDALMQTRVPTNCPHGRPITLRFSMHDILRGFERI